MRFWVGCISLFRRFWLRPSSVDSSLTIRYKLPLSLMVCKIYKKKKNRIFLNNLRISNPVAYVLAECHVTFGSYCHFLLLFGFQLSLFY